jgi:hypothetical protein
MVVSFHHARSNTLNALQSVMLTSLIPMSSFLTKHPASSRYQLSPTSSETGNTEAYAQGARLVSIKLARDVRLGTFEHHHLNHLRPTPPQSHSQPTSAARDTMALFMLLHRSMNCLSHPPASAPSASNAAESSENILLVNAFASPNHGLLAASASPLSNNPVV